MKRICKNGPSGDAGPYEARERRLRRERLTTPSLYDIMIAKPPKEAFMLAINVPADGLFLAVQNKAAGDYSKENCERIIHAYIGKMLEAKPDVILLNACYRRALTPSEVFDSYLYDVETDSDGYACRDAEGKSIKTLSPVSDNVSKYFASFFKCARVLLSRGIDIYQMAIDRIRESDTQVYLFLRMNDGHYTLHLSPTFWT